MRIILFFLLLCLFTGNISANSVSLDLLLGYLPYTKSKDQIYKSLNDQSLQHYNTEKEVEIQKSIIDLAIKKKDDRQFLISCKIIARNYYNRNMIDSVDYYVNMMYPVAVRNKDFQQYSYALSLICFKYISSNDFENTLIYLHNLQRLGEKYNCIYVDAVYNEVMARMYRKVGNFRQSIDFLEKSLMLIPVKKENNSKICQHYVHIIEQYLINKDHEKALGYIIKYDSIISKDNCESEYEVPIARFRKLCYIYYLSAYIFKNEEQMVEKYYHLLSEYEPVNDWHVEKCTYSAIANYHLYKKDYNTALDHINNAIAIRDSDKSLHLLKARILYMKGNYSQANEVLDLLYERQNKELDASMSRDVNNFFVNDEMSLAREHSTSLKISRQKTIFDVIVLITLIIFVIIMIMTYFHLRSQKIKDRLKRDRFELLNEKNNLQKAKLMLENARHKTEESNRLKSAFIANMSHEIRTPLNSIVGFSEIIENLAQNGSNQKKYASIIKYNSETLLHIVNNILELSRLDSGATRISISEICTTEIIENLCCEFRSETDKDIAFFHRKADRNIYITTDPHRFRQIIWILIENAVKFTDSGSITISERKTESALLISVRDTGCGIPGDKKHIIFERFEKLNHFTPGVGLSLAICQSLTEKANGNIYLNERYSDGAEFILEFPLSISSLEKQPPASSVLSL